MPQKPRIFEEPKVESFSFLPEAVEAGSMSEALAVSKKKFTVPHTKSYLDFKSEEMKALSDASAGRSGSGRDLLEIRSELTTSKDPIRALELGQEDYAAAITEGFNKVVENALSDDPRSTVPFLAPYFAQIDSIKQSYSGNQGASKALGDALAVKSVTDDLRKGFIAHNYLNRMFRESAEERTLRQGIADFSEVVVNPIAFTMSATKFAKLRGEDIDFVSGGIGAVKVAMKKYRSSLPEIQMAMAPGLIADIWAATDNELIAANLVHILDSPTMVSDLDFEATFDMVETGALVGSFGAFKPISLLARAFRQFSIKKSFKDMGNPGRAATAANKQFTRMERAMMADPMDLSEIPGGTRVIPGLSPSLQLEIVDRNKRIASKMLETVKLDEHVGLNVISKAEQSRQMGQALRRLDQIKVPDSITHKATPLYLNESGFGIQFIASEGDARIVRELNFDFTIDNIGSQQVLDSNLKVPVEVILTPWLLDPTALTRGFLPSMVKDTTYGGLQKSNINKKLNDSWAISQEPFEQINIAAVGNPKYPGVGARKQAEIHVSEVLLEGDRAEHVYTVEELKSGVQTLSGMRSFTDIEISAYYAKRQHLDKAGDLFNYSTRKDLVFKGYKEASYINEDGNALIKQVVKPFKGKNFLTDPDEMILAPIQAVDGMVARAGSLDKEIYDSMGFREVELFEPIKMGDNTIRKAILPGQVDGAAAIRELPNNIIERKTGWLPVEYPPNLFYVKEKSTGFAVARAKNRTEADEWIAAEQLKGGNTRKLEAARQKKADKEFVGPTKDGKAPIERVSKEERGLDGDYIVVRDGDFTSLESLSETIRTYGSLYTGHRSSAPLFAIGDLKGKLNQLSVGQTLDRMHDAVSFNMSLGTYRTALIKSWRDSTLEALKGHGATNNSPIVAKVMSDTDWMDAPLDLIQDVSTRTWLENSRDYMLTRLRIRSKEERLWEQKALKLADNMTDGSAAQGMVTNMASLNFTQALKSATFSSYLGMFNPANMYVQLQNATLASSMYPELAVTAWPQAILQRSMLYNKGEVDLKILDQMADGLVPKDKLGEVLQSIELYHASGLREGIIRHADHGTDVGGFSNGTLESVRSFVRSGNVFFTESEDMSRLVAWNIAWDLFKIKHGGRAITLDDVQEITDETLRINMNMQQEASAQYQNAPVVANLTQFNQPMVKFVENVAGGILGRGQWTKKEAWKALAGQFVNYGFVGTPIAVGISALLSEQLTDGNVDRLNKEYPNLVTAYEKGIQQVAFNNLGLANEITERGSLVGGVGKTFFAEAIKGLYNISTGDAQNLEITAPFVGVTHRAGDAVLELYKGIRSIAFTPSVEQIGRSSLDSLHAAAKIFTSYSKAHRVLYVEENGGLWNRKGTELLVSVDEFDEETLGTKMVAAMGFITDRESLIYSSRKLKMDKQKRQKESVDGLLDAYRKFLDHKNPVLWKSTLAWILAEYEGDPVLRDQLQQKALDKIYNGKSAWHTAVVQALDTYAKTGGLGPESIHRSIIKKDLGENNEQV